MSASACSHSDSDHSGSEGSDTSTESSSSGRSGPAPPPPPPPPPLPPSSPVIGCKPFASGVSYARDATSTVIGITCEDTTYLFHHGDVIKSSDIVTSTQEISHRVVLSGDLLFFATAMGRSGASNYWCLFCRLMKRMWQDSAACGDLWTAEKLKQKRDEVFKTYFPGRDRIGISYEERDACCKKLGTKREGLRYGEDELFDGDIDDYIVPTLHIILGLTKDLWDKLDEEIVLKIQNCSPAMLAKRVAVSTLKMSVEDKEDVVLQEEDRILALNEKGTLKTLEQELKGLEIRLATARASPPLAKKRKQGGAEEVFSIEELEDEMKKKTAKVAQSRDRLAKEDAAFKELSKKVKEEEKKLAAAKKSLKEAIAKEPFGECEKAVTAVLAKFKISREVYFGGAFIGPACKVISSQSAAIFKQLRVVLKQHKRDGVTDEFIDDTLFKFDALFRQFDICASIMRSVDMQTDEAIEAFRLGSKKFGEMWRKAFAPRPRVTPKLHILETHAYAQLFRLGVLGLFSEDPIERLHHQHLVATKRVCNVREYEKRERYLWQREAAINCYAAQKISNNVDARRKRKFSKKSLEKKLLKFGPVDEKLKVKIEGATDFYNKSKY